MRCYNCGEFANHIASECAIGPQPKRCHRCRSEDHLHADCPHRSAAMVSYTQIHHAQCGVLATESLAKFTFFHRHEPAGAAKALPATRQPRLTLRQKLQLPSATAGAHLKFKTCKIHLKQRTKRIKSKKYLTYNPQQRISAVIFVCETRY